MLPFDIVHMSVALDTHNEIYICMCDVYEENNCILQNFTHRTYVNMSTTNSHVTYILIYAICQ